MTTAKTVKVEAEMDAGVLKWKIDSKEPKDAKLELEPKTGDYKIEFSLDDDAKMGLRFDCSNPFWVEENTGGGCPKPGMGSKQIEVIECKTDQLTITDKNSGAGCILNYRLNFKDGGGTLHDVDPEIKNGGG